MQFPLSFWDVSVWIAVTAIILQATAELISPRYGRINLIIEKKRLKKVALFFGVLFLMTFIVRIYEVLTT